MTAKAKIGIIGGTGVYDPKMFKLKETLKLSTPYGAPSDDIQIGDMGGVRIAFMQRHGPGHIYPPLQNEIMFLNLSKLRLHLVHCCGGSLPET